jgi:hypothetical protein
MPRFIVRVELVNIAHTHPSYETLHTAMELDGFSREMSRGRANYKLPHAEYRLDDPRLDAAKVCARVKDLATNVAQKVPTVCRVLVSEMERETAVDFWNLETA